MPRKAPITAASGPMVRFNDRRASIDARHGDLQSKQDRLANAWEEAKAIMQHDDGTLRAPSPDEQQRYAALEREMDGLGAEIEKLEAEARRDLLNSDAAAKLGGSPSRTPYAANRPLAKDQTMVGAVRALGWDQDTRDLSQMRDEDGRDLSFQAMLRNGLNNGAIRNAMGGGSGSTGGYLIPTLLWGELIDLARNESRVMQAGAHLVPMDNRRVDVPKWATDPVAAWRAENAAITESDGALGVVTLTAKTLAVVTRVSREAIEDTDLANELLKAFAASFALAFDKAALYGPAGGDGPVGLKNIAGITKTPLAANGATPTYDNLVDSAGRLRDVNEDPSAQIMNDRTLRTLAKLKDSANQYLTPPTYLDDIPRLGTNQVPNNLTVGTSNDTSDVFTADWSQLLLGVRKDITIQVLNERYADNGQIGFLCWFRGDVQPARPAAFDIVTGVRP